MSAARVVSRSIFPLVNDVDRAYFGGGDSSDQVGVIHDMRTVFGRTYADAPQRLLEQLRVEYNGHVIESIPTHVAPALGWGRPESAATNIKRFAPAFV